MGVKIRMAHSAKRTAKKAFSRRSALCSLRYAIRSPSPLSPPARGGERTFRIDTNEANLIAVSPVQLNSVVTEKNLGQEPRETKENPP